jgi:hypothetical protein
MASGQSIGAGNLQKIVFKKHIKHTSLLEHVSPLHPPPATYDKSTLIPSPHIMFNPIKQTRLMVI